MSNVKKNAKEKEKKVEDVGKIVISLTTENGYEYQVTKKFTAYLANYLNSEVYDCTRDDPPELDNFQDWIECAIEAFEGGAR